MLKGGNAAAEYQALSSRWLLMPVFHLRVQLTVCLFVCFFEQPTSMLVNMLSELHLWSSKQKQFGNKVIESLDDTILWNLWLDVA